MTEGKRIVPLSKFEIDVIVVPSRYFNKAMIDCHRKSTNKDAIMKLLIQYFLLIIISKDDKL